jgi:hypothetical protein
VAQIKGSWPPRTYPKHSNNQACIHGMCSSSSQHHFTHSHSNLRAFLSGITTGNTAQVRVLRPHALSTKDSAVVELRMANRHGRSTAGQWVFVCVPSLGLLHWHPFTISSASHDEDLTLHIGAGGHWTNCLVDMAAKRKAVKVWAISSVCMHQLRFLQCGAVSVVTLAPMPISTSAVSTCPWRRALRLHLEQVRALTTVSM